MNLITHIHFSHVLIKPLNSYLHCFLLPLPLFLVHSFYEIGLMYKYSTSTVFLEIWRLHTLPSGWFSMPSMRFAVSFPFYLRGVVSTLYCLQPVGVARHGLFHKFSLGVFFISFLAKLSFYFSLSWLLFRLNVQLWFFSVRAFFIEKSMILI